MLGVVGGHVIGLLVPQSWTDAVGISEHVYHVVAVAGGLVAGMMALVGMAILIYRRRTVGPVFTATTRNDKLMYAVLALAIILGLAATTVENIVGGGYDYRETVSPWFRSVITTRESTLVSGGRRSICGLPRSCASVGHALTLASTCTTCSTPTTPTASTRPTVTSPTTRRGRLVGVHPPASSTPGSCESISP